MVIISPVAASLKRFTYFTTRLCVFVPNQPEAQIHKIYGRNHFRRSNFSCDFQHPPASHMYRARTESFSGYPTSHSDFHCPSGSQMTIEQNQAMYPPRIESFPSHSEFHRPPPSNMTTESKPDNASSTDRILFEGSNSSRVSGF